MQSCNFRRMEQNVWGPRPATAAELPRHPRTAVAMLEGLLAAAASDPLSPRELAPITLLLLLEVSPGPMTFGGVRERLHIQAFEVTRLCDRLEQLGMVRRVLDVNDNRRRRVQILDAGRIVVDQLVRPVRALVL